MGRGERGVAGGGSVTAFLCEETGAADLSASLSNDRSLACDEGDAMLKVGDLVSCPLLCGTRERKRMVSSAKTSLSGDGLLPFLEAVMIFFHNSAYSPSSMVIEKASATRVRG